MKKASYILETISKLLERKEPELENFSDPLEYLYELRDYYNEKYFNGLLKQLILSWLRQTSSYNTSTLGQYNKVKSTIQLSKLLLRDIPALKDTLLHEMCHQAVEEIDSVEEVHGTCWQKWAKLCGITANRMTKANIETESEKEHINNITQESILLSDFSVGTCCYYIEKGKKNYCRIYSENENSEKISIIQRGTKSFSKYTLSKSLLYEIVDTSIKNNLIKDIPDKLLEMWTDYLHISENGDYSKNELMSMYIDIDSYQNNIIKTTKRLVKPSIY